MTRIKRKYIDSHWLIFAVQGIITFLCGWYIMFSGSQDTTFLITVVGTMLLALGLVEMFNLLHREKAQVTWGFTLFAVVFEIASGLLLLFTSNENTLFHLVILAAYTFARGVCELFIAFKSIDDRTDRFIWGLCGVCGVVIGFVVLNAGHLAAGTFIKFFASYLVILGAGNLLYGVHNRDQALDLAEEKQRAKLAKKTVNKRGTKRTTKRSKKAKK